MSNLKITADIGLHTDYGVFNLDATVVPENIKVDIITNGDQYVNSEETNFQHGGNSSYREHEGIKPINSNSADWSRYGSKLAIILQNYTSNLITSYENGELWESYVKYANQFEVKFDKEEKDCDLKYQYISYTNQLVDANTKKVITYKLSELYTGVNLQAYIIHFSKYYNIYSSTSGSQQVLRPLLYYNTDLDTYNMEIKEKTSGFETIGIPYINYLIGLEYYRTKSSHRRECVYTFIESYNTSNESYEYDTRTVISNNYKRSDSGDDWTQFHTHPHNSERIPFEDWDTEKWNQFPEGFYVWGLHGDHEYFFNKNNQGNTNTTDTFPTLYKTIFKANDYKCWRDNTTGGHIHGNDQETLIGIMYRHDRKSNWHIFNTYFPVESSSNKITQKIKYKSTTSPYPKYIGMILASILASLYVYGDTPSGNIKYISDIVYLNDHSTIYTKDIAYRVYKSTTEKTDNQLLLLHKRPFDSYVNRLKDFVKDTEDLDKKFNDTNVTAIIEECIKNVPLQFKLNYLQPELNTIGEHASVRVCTIDGQEIDCSSDIVRPNQLYYLDDNNVVNFLNKNFKIKWLKSLTKGDDKLIGIWDNTLQPLTNAYLKESINFDEGRFGFNTTEIISTQRGQCYSIVSHNGSYPNYYTDLLINDILVPTARII